MRKLIGTTLGISVGICMLIINLMTFYSLAYYVDTVALNTPTDILGHDFWLLGVWFCFPLILSLIVYYPFRNQSFPSLSIFTFGLAVYLFLQTGAAVNIFIFADDLTKLYLIYGAAFLSQGYYIGLLLGYLVFFINLAKLRTRRIKNEN